MEEEGEGGRDCSILTTHSTPLFVCLFVSTDFWFYCFLSFLLPFLFVTSSAMPAKKAAKSDKKTKKSTKGKTGRVGLAIYIFRIIRQVGGKKFGVSSRGMGCDFLF